MSRVLFLILLIALLITLPVDAQTTQNPTPTATIIGNYVVAADIYVRGGPGETYLPVGRLIEGVPVYPVNISEDGNWVLIRYSRGFGWIRRDLALWTADIDALPTMDESDLTPTVIATETPTSRPTGVQVEAGAEGAYVRFGPSVNYPFLGAVVTGDFVEPVGQNVEGTWILIRFRDGFGWVARSLLARDVPLNNLPILLPDALTPSPTLPASDTPTITLTPSATDTPSATPTATLIPTNTPIFTATNTETNTATATATLIPTNTQTITDTATRTFTPTAVPTDTATFTATATSTETATATATTLPTNTATATATDTATLTTTPTETIVAATDTPTETPTETATATFTASSTPTNTPAEMTTSEAAAMDEVRVTPAINAGLEQMTLTRTATTRVTRTPSQTSTSTATDTVSETPTSTNTASPTLTDTPTETATMQPSDTLVALAAATRTPRPTATRLPTETATSLPTQTASETATATDTRTPRPTRTATNTEMPTQSSALVEASEAVTEVIVASPTVTARATNTPTALATASETMTSTVTPSETASPTETMTLTSVPAIVLPTPVSTLPESSEPPAPTVPPEAVVGGALVALLIGYIGLYWRGLTVADRYADGFVIDRCPVCREGHLSVEMRHARVLGIPRPRYTVRCDTCRSVLREAGERRWRYAVDPSENPPIYNRFNGKVIDETVLRVLEGQALDKRSLESPPIHPPDKPPTFVDDED